jgi:hypothetical protein
MSHPSKRELQAASADVRQGIPNRIISVAGGHARAKAMTAYERAESARKAAKARWAKRRQPTESAA